MVIICPRNGFKMDLFGMFYQILRLLFPEQTAMVTDKTDQVMNEIVLFNSNLFIPSKSKMTILKWISGWTTNRDECF